MSHNQKKRRIGLSIKLNIILVISILLVSIGLVAISYYFYCKKVDSLYYDRVERAADAMSESYVAYDTILFLWNTFNSDEFKAVREKAIAQDDDKIIEDWMRNTPLRIEGEYASIGVGELNSVYDEYDFYSRTLSEAKETFGLESAYLEYVLDGKSYVLIDPDIRLREIGTEEEPIKEFEDYKGNDRIPATTYKYKDKWLCTACEPVTIYHDGQSDNVMQVGADLDMDNVINERYWFILNSALFIVILMVIIIIVSVIISRKFIVNPLKQLSKGAMDFAKGEGDFSREDVIDISIESNDEIGDLYQEIQSMQWRIIDGADKLTKVTAEKEKVNTELRMASSIQNSMLPSVFPDRKEFELYASMEPAKEVGGDFYDFFFIDDNHLCIIIADVSDKGVPAALYMMSSKIIIKYRAEQGGTPAEILTEVGRKMKKDNKSMMFVTVWMGILDISTGIMTCTNAGHEKPIIKSGDGEFRICMDDHGPMVGVFNKVEYQDYKIELNRGDVVFVYTDGVVEATNTSDEMYKIDRLVDTLNEVKDKTPEEISSYVRQSVNEFVNGANQFDDLTMLCLKYKGND